MRLKVYRNQYGWSTMCATKYGSVDDKCYMRIRFVKCEEPQGDDAYIEEKGAKFGAYKKKVEEGKFIDFPTMTIFKYEVVDSNTDEVVKSNTDTDKAELEWY